MVIEFVDGILDKQEKMIAELVERITAPVDGRVADQYVLRVQFYTQLRWVYVWYQCIGRIQI